jgi:hypothetical protein
MELSFGGLSFVTNRPASTHPKVLVVNRTINLNFDSIYITNNLTQKSGTRPGVLTVFWPTQPCLVRMGCKRVR